MATLADWTVPAGRVEVTAAAISPNAGSILYRDDTPADLTDTPQNGALADGSLEISPGYYITRIISPASRHFQLNDTPQTDDISAFFAAGGAGHDLRIHVLSLTTSGYFDVADATVHESTAQRVRWSGMTTDFERVISDAISFGTAFVIAFTREQAVDDAPTVAITTAAGTVDGLSVTTISGTVSDTEDDDGDVTVTASSTLGTLGAVTRNGGDWSVTLTAPAVAAAVQDMAVTVSAEDSAGNTTTAERTWTVRANQAPTVSITTLAQTIDAGASVALAAVAAAPETGQAVTVAWTADGGTFTEDSGLAASWDPAVSGVEIVYTITATATDALGLEAVSTVEITVRAADLIPVAEITTPAQTVDGGAMVQLALDASGGNGTLTFAWRSAGGAFDDAAGQDPIWTAPAPAQLTVYALSVEVRDADGDAVTVTVRITVRPSPIPARDMAAIVGQPFNIRILADTTLTAPVVYAMTNLPAGAVFDAGGRDLSWRPDRSAARVVTFTATGADGAVNTTRFLLIAHEPGRPRYTLLIDWDGDGSYSHPLSDAFDDLTKAGVRTRRGRNYASMIYGRSVAGTLDATLLNDDGAYDRFAASSELQGLLLPRRRLLFALAAAGRAVRLWTGFLDKVNKVARTGGNDIVKMHATDIISDLARIDCGVAYTAETTIADAFSAVLDAAGIDANDRGNINAAVDISNYFAADAKALLHLRQLEEAAAGFLWVSAAGQIRLDGVNQRYTEQRSRREQVTITDRRDYGPDALPLLPPPQEHDPLKDIANIVSASVRTWNQSNEAELWRLPTPLALEPGQSATLVITHKGTAIGRNDQTGRFEGSRDQAVAGWIEPVANTDYTAASQEDGSGADLTASITHQFSAAGTSARLQFTNTHASLAAFVEAAVRGTVLNEGEPIVLELRDEDSINAYGPRPYTVASDLLPSVNEARTYAEYILRLYAQPTRKAEVSIEMGDNLALAGALDLSDRVHYAARDIAADMYIESISHILRPGLRHDMTVTLSQAGLFDDVIILNSGPGLGTGILGS